MATLGAGAETELSERAVAPPDARPFRAATIDWTYSAAGEPDDELFHSALVAPLVAPAGAAGTLVAYAIAADAFTPAHTAAVHELLARYGTALHNARRFADVEARILLDPATGIASRRGYELELEREVARASRTGRPLSVVLVGVGNGTDTATTGEETNGIGEFARLLTRITRKSDISCRRGDHEFAILLPETREEGADDPHRAAPRGGEANARIAPVDVRGGARGVATERVARSARGAGRGSADAPTGRQPRRGPTSCSRLPHRHCSPNDAHRCQSFTSRRRTSSGATRSRRSRVRFATRIASAGR